MTGDAPSIYGFRIHGAAALRFLRSGGGVESLEITAATEDRTRPDTEPLADWALAGGAGDARATLYRAPRGFEFWATDAGGYHVDPEAGRIEIPQGGDEIVREQRLWGLPATLCYLHRGDLPLHAAAVEVSGGAVVLAAPSRYGKTTLALAFHERGYRVLSEDLTCCRPGAEPAVLPGPAVLRVRPDMYRGNPPEGTQLIVTRPDRVFLGLDPARRGSSAPVPLRGIVFLRESSERMGVERAPNAAALADLWHLNFRLQTDAGRARSFQQLTSLVSAVPVWNLHRPLERASLSATVDLIATRTVGGVP